MKSAYNKLSDARLRALLLGAGLDSRAMTREQMERNARKFGLHPARSRTGN